MKNTAKKLVILVLAICMLCGLFVVPDYAYAAEMTPVTPNVAFTGSLETGDTKNYYSFTVDKTGYFNIDFSLADVTADTRDGWYVELCRDTGTCIYSTRLTSNATLPAFNFKKGTKLYIAISAYATWDIHVPIGQVYTVNIISVEDASWEQEDNDTSANATLITEDKTYRGNLYCCEDEDYYQYTVAHNGYFNIDFSLADVTADTKEGWILDLYNAATGTKLYSTHLESGVTLPVFNFKKGTKLYIVVSAYASSWDIYVPLWQEYSVKIKTTKDASWEQETLIGGNEAWSTRSKNATSMTLGKKYCGNMYTDDDNDLYKFTTKATGNVTVTFDPDDVESNLGRGYTVSILTKSGKVVKEERVCSVTGVKVYLKKGTYYAEVCSNYDGPVLKKYIISANYKSYTPAKVSSIKAKGTKVSWKKVTGADGYEVCYSQKSSFKNAEKGTVTTPSCEFIRLQSKKTYYVRVRAYKLTGTGTKVYGAWSSTVKVRKK